MPEETKTHSPLCMTDAELRERCRQTAQTTEFCTKIATKRFSEDLKTGMQQR